MKTQIFIGVDGGATKSVIRIEAEDGQVFGQSLNGPASIRISILDTWNTILSGVKKILEPHNIDLHDPNFAFYAGLGLAGCEIESAYHAFKNYAHPFAKLAVTSDSHIACLAAHRGMDGAIIIAGTGTVGYQIANQKTTQVGGWGFPHDDEGGGAWLGMQAMRMTLQWRDGRLQKSNLVTLIDDHFGNDLKEMVAWANQATPRLFATLAPLVIGASQNNDPDAIALLQRAADAINQIDKALFAAQDQNSKPLPCALLGSIAPFLQPYLSEQLKMRLQPSQLSPDQGAILYIKQQMSELLLVE